VRTSGGRVPERECRFLDVSGPRGQTKHLKLLVQESRTKPRRSSAERTDLGGPIVSVMLLGKSEAASSPETTGGPPGQKITTDPIRSNEISASHNLKSPQGRSTKRDFNISLFDVAAVTPMSHEFWSSYRTRQRSGSDSSSMTGNRERTAARDIPVRSLLPKHRT